MRSNRLVVRRARAQAGLLALIALLAGLVTATLGLTLGYTGLAAQEGVTAALRDARPQAAALQVHTRSSADDPDLQQRAADEVFAAAFGDVPLTVVRSARSLTLGAATPDGAVLGDVVAGADEALAEHVVVEDGTWPAADGADDAVPVAVQADAAADLGLGVGDDVVLTGDDARAVPLTVRVAALWRATDADDPRWFGDPLVSGGTDGSAAGPFVVAEDDLTALPGLVLVRWTLVPDAERLAPADLPALLDGLDVVEGRLLDDDAVNRQGVAVSGDLAATIGRVDGVLAAVRGVSAAAALLAVLVGLVVLGQLARLLVEVRGPETVLLRSRGVTAARLARWSAVEAAVVLAVGGVLGAAAGAAALGLVGPVPVALVVGCLVGVVLGGTALLTALAGGRASRALRAGRADARRRGAGAATGALVLLAVVTAVAVWRLRDLGAPVVVGAGGRAVLDPVAVAAVPLTLVLVALLAAALLGPVVRTGERRAARRRDLGPALTRRQIVRRPAAHAAAAVLAALTVATSVLVAVYAGSWQAQLVASRAAEIGADLRVDLTSADDVRALADAVSDVPGVTRAVPVLTQVAALGGASATLVAVPAAGLDDVLLTPAGQSPVDLAGDAADALPAVFSRTLLDAAGLAVGDTATVRTGGQEVPVTVVAAVPVVAGAEAPAALLVDLDALTDATGSAGATGALEPDEVWASTTGDRADVAEAVHAALGTAGVTTGRVRTADPEPASLSAPAVVVFWIAAGSALLLAAGGVGAASRALARERVGEVGVLRGLGLGGAAQGRQRAAELGRSLAVAAGTGLVGGALVAVVGARTLVRATAGSVDGVTVAGPLAVHPLGAGLLLGGTAVLLALVVLDAARLVRAQAGSARVRQEAEQ